MKLIVGLGNPGKEYEKTRHNVGFMVLDRLAQEHDISIKRKAFGGLCGQGRMCGQQVMLLKPQTFMNLSGESVRAALSKVEDVSELLLVYDDIDILLGGLRFRPDGSSGGHKGVQSVIEELGTSVISRLRIGIGGERQARDAASFVLSEFSQAERNGLEEIVNRAVKGIETWVEMGISKSMERFNKSYVKNAKGA